MLKIHLKCEINLEECPKGAISLPSPLLNPPPLSINVRSDYYYPPFCKHIKHKQFCFGL